MKKNNFTINTFELWHVLYVNARYEQNFKTQRGYFVFSLSTEKKPEKNTVLLKFPSENAHS